MIGEVAEINSQAPLLLGIDIGTSSLKMGLFTLEGACLGVEQHHYPLFSPFPGWAESDPELWWQGFLEMFPVLVRKAGVNPSRIKAVGLSDLSSSMVPLDRDGNPLRRSIIYSDLRSSGQINWIKERIQEDEFILCTGNRLAPGLTVAASILWMKQAEPELYDQTACFGFANTFFAHRLCGSMAMDWTNAFYLGLIEAETRKWSSEIVNKLELDPGKFPPIIESSAMAGRVSRHIFELTGLPGGIPVAMGAVDAAAAALGAGTLAPGEVLEITGSSNVLSFCTAGPVCEPNFLTRPAAAGNLWSLNGSMSTGGLALKWVGEIAGESDFGTLARWSKVSGPGAGGVIFLPYLQGERSPLWNPKARGVFFGLSLDTSREDLVRAVLEGVGFGTRHVVEEAEALLGASVPYIMASGGGARSAEWMQIKADILGIPVNKLRIEETTVLGAAMLGGIAGGFYTGSREAMERAATTVAYTAEPDPKRHRIYSERYQTFRGLYTSIIKYF